MLLNNNWSLNVDLNKWNPNAEGLVKTDFDALKQDVQSYRFYQKCLSGSTYVGVNSIIRGSRENAQIDDIYEIINHTDKSKSYYYDSISLTFSQTFNSQTPSNGFKIDTLEDQDLFLTKSLPDYNFTLKNLFTPDRLIKDQKSNVFYVDLSTTDRIENINSELIGLQIDGFFVREGQRVLVKDQYEEVTIPITIDPDTYFFGFYQIQEEVGSNITYRIPSSENGVYIYLRKRLVRTSELDAYENLVRYSIGVKMGLNNREKEYKLKRLNSGFYPDYQTGITYTSGSIGESIYFEESHNFVLRQRVDYNNLFELSLNSTLAHVTQSITIDISTQTQSSTASYTIPQRILTIGEFGTIIVDQEGTTNIIPSKYKTTLRSISENTKYYWCVGDEGLLLRINKQDFEIKRISLDFPENAEQPSSRVLTRLNSIHFFNDLRGAIVGKFNQIWVTSDSGRTWKQIYLQDFDGFNFNSVVFTSIDTFFVGGDNGVFIEFNYNLGNWNILKRRISKLVDGIDDEFPLVDDIRDLHYFNSSGSNFIALGCELNKIYLYDIDGVYAGSPSDFIFLQDVNNINNFGDVTALTWISSTSSLFFSTFDSIYQVDPFIGQFVGTNSNIFSVTFSQFIPQSGTNDIISFSASISSDELIYTGNFSLWKKSDLTPAPTDVYDPTFFDRLKPRLLFMDYDIGSKLYWFDDFSQYRIPERYGITISYLQDIGSNTYIAFNENTNSVFDANTSTTITYSETNWITYFKDRQKTFEFYSGPALDESTKVEPSFTFSSSDAVGITFSYSTSSVSTDYSDIVGLMPIAVPRGSAPSLTQSSRFRNIAGVSITIPANPYNLYFYDYLGIWNESFVSGDITPDVGDVLQIDSDVFEGDFIINKIICTSSLVGGSPAQGQIRFMINFPGNPTWSGTFSINLFDSMGTTTSIFGPTFIDGASYSSTFQFLNDVVTPYINSNTQFQTFATLISGPKGIGFASLNITSPVGTTWNGTTASVTFLPTPTGLATLPGKPVGYIPGILSGGIDPISGENCFMYFYTDFNENILNNITNSQTGFTVRDLNKYPLTPTSTSSDYFVDNFNKHYIGLSYDCEIVDNNATQSFLVTPKYSQWSAYYNLQTTVDVLDVNSNIYSDETKYASGFLNFGYSPTYNLLSYLNFIDPSEYVPGKEFLAMPHYLGIPGPDSLSLPEDRIWIDTGLPTNKIKFGSNLKYIWDSYLKWTFINVSLNTDENDFCFNVPGEIHDLQDSGVIQSSIGSITGLPTSGDFSGTYYQSFYSEEGSGWEITVSTGSGEVLVNENDRINLENLYGFSFSSQQWQYDGITSDCSLKFIAGEDPIPSTTDVYAFLDTSSMNVNDVSNAIIDIENWYISYAIANPDYDGNIFTLPTQLNSERWLQSSEVIWKGDLLISTGIWLPFRLGLSASGARGGMTFSGLTTSSNNLYQIFGYPSTASYVPSSDVIVISFFDETESTYHGSSIVGFTSSTNAITNGTFGSNTNWTITNQLGGFATITGGVLNYVDVGGSGNSLVVQSNRLVPGTSYTVTIRNDNNISVDVYVGDENNTYLIVNSNASDGNYTTTFTATGNNFRIEIISTGPNAQIDLDNVSAFYSIIQPTESYKRDYWAFTRDSNLPTSYFGPTPSYNDGGFYSKFNYFKAVLYPLVRNNNSCINLVLQGLGAIIGTTISTTDIDDSISGGSIDTTHPFAGLEHSTSPAITNDYRVDVTPITIQNPYSALVDNLGNPGLQQFGWKGKWDKRSNYPSGGTSSTIVPYPGTPPGYDPWASFANDLNNLFQPAVPPVDINLYINTPRIDNSDRLLIIDKFYDNVNGWYVIELHDVIKSPISPYEPYANYSPFYPNLTSISILYRRFLHQVSDDLQYINRIHRPKYPDNRTGHSDSYSFNAFALSASQVFGQYGNYETDINFKVPTDSYCKFLLSDSNIIKDLTGILYTDYKYELAMQVNKLDREYELEVTSITQSGGLYEFQFSDNHLLNSNEWVVVSLIGTQSDFPDDLLGYHNIQVTGTGSFILPITPGILSGTIGLKISHVKKDYFFNYQPIDIFDMGIDDKKITQSVEVLWENWDVFGQTYNLLNLNLDKYKFRLIDGLDIVQLNSKFQWILEAEISDAIIGMDKSGNLIWYKGIWHCGRWFGGRWISGSWLSGDWYFGDWTSKSIEDNKLSVKIGETNTTSVNSYWYGGRWFGGTWDNGTWYEGRWYGGTWSNGRWFEGIWNDGTWNNGEFKSGIWVLGQWNNGIFNETNGPSFWLDGEFYGGDFETGTWYNGIFDQKNNVLSRFGTKSTNSRNSLWRSGKFLNGQFHSFLNEDSNGVPQVSDVHKYSIWKTGLFSKGDFYGGLVYNINFKNTVWHGGILEDIEVLDVSTASNTFTLSGEWNWNINDEFYLVDNMLGGTFSIYGSTVNPIRYKVLRTEYDSINDETIVNTNVNLSNLLTGNPIENSWVVVEIEENITQSPPTLQIFSLFQDSVTSGSFFSELVGSNWYIQNGQINLIQNNAPLYSITSQLSGQSTYTTSVINLDNFIGVLGPGNNDYDITFNTNGTVTLSLTQANPPNISGVIINITLEPSYSLRCVSSFENSTWKSGLWRNGVFRGGNFLGGVWYNGFMGGNFG
jgi:hypothetical protein